MPVSSPVVLARLGDQQAKDESKQKGKKQSMADVDGPNPFEGIGEEHLDFFLTEIVRAPDGLGLSVKEITGTSFARLAVNNVKPGGAAAVAGLVKVRTSRGCDSLSEEGSPCVLGWINRGAVCSTRTSTHCPASRR